MSRSRNTAPSRPNGALRLALVTAAGCALGCATTGDVPSETDGGALYAGEPCVWAESRPDLTFPTCSVVETSEFIGTLDGKPFHELDSGHFLTGPVETIEPYTGALPLWGWGVLRLRWGDPWIIGQWVDVTGTFIPTLGAPERPLLPGSELIHKCGESSYLFILKVEDGDLTGCTH